MRDFVEDRTKDRWQSLLKLYTSGTPGKLQACPSCVKSVPPNTENSLQFGYDVERDTCTVHGRNIKTRYLGLILTLRLKRD